MNGSPNLNSHPERTASQPRQSNLHNASISYIRPINSRIRLIRLALPYALGFLPGQWLDLHIPSLPHHTGGFTITSPPSLASPPTPTTSPSRSSSPDKAPAKPKPAASCPASKPPYLDLAIQASPDSPPAAWLWKPEKEILGQAVKIRIGGSFVWPPWKAKGGEEGIPEGGVRRVVFVAGGVGINPLISILTHLCSVPHSSSIPQTIRLLYSTRLYPEEKQDPTAILFLPRLRRIFSDWSPPDGDKEREQVEKRLDLHLTYPSPSLTPDAKALNKLEPSTGVHVHHGRITRESLREALGAAEEGQREGTVVYVCGPAGMTDEVVGFLEKEEGMAGRVLVEKWW